MLGYVAVQGGEDTNKFRMGWLIREYHVSGDTGSDLQ